MSYLQGVEWGVYDNWKCTDLAEEQAAFSEFKFESELNWIKSHIELEFPYLSEEDVEILAHERYESCYYDVYEF